MKAPMVSYPFGAMAEGCSSAVSRTAALYGAAVIGQFAVLLAPEAVHLLGYRSRR